MSSITASEIVALTYASHLTLVVKSGKQKSANKSMNTFKKQAYSTILPKTRQSCSTISTMASNATSNVELAQQIKHLPTLLQI